jgi:tRNA nucleotidyltransferase (CCA-adding enzyme)
MTINLASKIERELTPPITALLKVVGEIAHRRGEDLYLVGGVVRDLLLERPNHDLDLVVDGDAIQLAHKVTSAIPGKITVHDRFGTAKIQYPDLSFDLTTARAEHYRRPGALPTVRPGTIRDDLFRRDFTINAMAIRLTPPGYGELLDLYGGLDDLENKLVRILHDKSFADDATRIWRALRYEQRLNFQMEDGTLSLLKRNIPMLSTISGDRIRYELECVFIEAEPEKVLRRAAELEVLQRLHPNLTGNDGLEEAFQRARELNEPKPPAFALYLALLARNLSLREAEQLSDYLRLPKPTAQTVRDSINLKSLLPELKKVELKPSRVYQLLSGHTPTALTAISLTAPPEAKAHIDRFLARYRYVRPALNGNDLIALGITPGPRIKETLARLRAARLDGEAAGKQQELSLVKRWLKEK